MVAIRHLGFFKIVKILVTDGVKRADRHHRANFVKIGQTVFEIWQYFDCSRWQPSAILDLFGTNLNHPQRVLDGLITMQNLVTVDAVVSKVRWFEFFTSLACKRPFAPPKSGWGNFTPKWAAVSVEEQAEN